MTSAGQRRISAPWTAKPALIHTLFCFLLISLFNVSCWRTRFYDLYLEGFRHSLPTDFWDFLSLEEGELGAEAGFRNSWPTAKTVASLCELRQTEGGEEDIQSLDPQWKGWFLTSMHQLIVKKNHYYWGIAEAICGFLLGAYICDIHFKC